MSWMGELSAQIDRVASNVAALLTCHASMLARIDALEGRVIFLEGLEEEFSELHTKCRIYRRRVRALEGKVKALEAAEVKA